MSIQELAKKAREYFVRTERRDGVGIWTVKADAPKWVSDLCYRARNDGDLLPDDWRYRFVVESLDALSELSECDEPYDVYLHADIYPYELSSWYSSHPLRTGWVEQAVEMQGWDNLTAALQAGQAMEKNHVLGLVRGFLRELETHY